MYVNTFWKLEKNFVSVIFGFVTSMSFKLCIFFF